MKFKIALLFLSMFIGFGIVELGLRLFVYLNKEQKTAPIYFANDAGRGFVLLKKNIDKYIYSDEAQRAVHFKTNAEGFLGENYSLEKPSDVFRIAIVGDSFTEGAPFVDYEKTFPYLFERRLNTRRDTNYEIMNFCMVDQSTVDELYYYDAYVRKYQPDLVILATFLGNDISDNLRYIDRKEFILASRDLSTAGLKEKPAVPTTNTAPLRLSKRIVNAFLRSRALHTLYQSFFIQNDWFFEAKWFVRATIFNKPFEPDPNVFINIWPYTNLADSRYVRQKEVLDFTGDVIGVFGKRVKQNNGAFALLIIPSPWQIDKKLTRRLTRFNPTIDLFVPNAILKNKLDKEFPILDLSSALSDAINKEHKEAYIRGVWHFTEEGNAIVAEELLRFMKERRF